MKPFSIVIALSVTAVFLIIIVYFNGNNVIAAKISDKLKHENGKRNKKLDPLKKRDKKMKKQKEENLKKAEIKNIIMKDAYGNNYLTTKQMQKQFQLSDQLAEAKEKCWDVEKSSERHSINPGNLSRGASTWMVAIFQNVQTPSKSTKLIGGGCLISSRYVLTSARHFFNGSRYWLFTQKQTFCVGYEIHDLSPGNYKEADVVKIHIHPEYLFPDGYYSDLALVELKQNITYGVNPICIPNLTTPDDWVNVKVNSLVIFSHWKHSDIKFKPNANAHLHKGLAFIKEASVCNTTFVHKFRYNTSTTICIEEYQNANKLCEGDEGSPVVPVSIASETPIVEYPVVIGIVSAGGKNCSAQHILTKVELYIDWINNITKN